MSGDQRGLTLPVTPDAILVVDDDPGVTLLLREFLEQLGYRTLTAHSGSEALRILEESPVALLLLDLHLPDMDGLEVMRRAHERAVPPDIVIVTGQATLESAIQAVENGTAGYIPKPLDLSRLRVVVGQVFERRRLIRENARLSAENAERLRESEALVALSTTINSTLDMREALRQACRELCRLLGADTGAAYLHDAASDQLLPFAGYRVPKELLPVLLGTPLALGEQGFRTSLWQERRPVLSQDVARDPRFGHELFRQFPHQSGLVLPLVLDGEVAGAFYLVWWTARRVLTEHEFELIEHVTTQITILLRHARLFERAERERRRLDALYDISRRLAQAEATDEVLSLLVEEATELLGVEAAGIRLREGDELVVGARTESAAALMATPRSKLGVSLSSQIVASGEAISVEDLVEDPRFDHIDKQDAVEQGFHGFLGVPLRLHGDVIGALVVYTKSRRRFQPDEFSLLSALADQASLAIHKARLYEESRAREREAVKLYETTSALASSLDADWILDQITSKTMDLLGSDASGIFVYDAGRAGLIFRRSANLNPELTQNLQLKPGEGVAGRAFQNREASWTSDRLADSSLRYSAQAAPLIEATAPRAYLAAPIMIRDEVLGVLMAYFLMPHEFSPKEIQLLSILAGHAAIAIDNAHHYGEVRLQRARLEQIFDSTSDGIVLVSREGCIEAANRRAGELLGFDPERELGIRLTELRAGRHDATPVQARSFATLTAVTQSPEREARGDLELQEPNRILHWVAQPTKNPGGTTTAFTLTFRDVTQEREVSRMKSDFVSFVTHQLRTPLGGISWMLELAAEEPALPPEASSYIQDARDSAQRLITLVNDLLDISRLERGKLTLTLTELSLEDLTQELIGELQLLIAEKGHHVSVVGDGSVPPVTADRQLLRQAVMNLLSNAVKYTPLNGKIAIRIERGGDGVQWSIRDSGIGIPHASQARLFEKFYRAENVTIIETEGTGLGLYLARLIMEQFGGRVWCESEEGAGATFFFTLPLTRG
jgi:PAS domain S-box-containing protein